MQRNNSNDQVAHKNIWKISDVIFVLVIFFGFIFEQLIPLTLKEFIPRCIQIIFGTIILSFGIFIVVKTRLNFKKYNQPTLPNKVTTKLITDGSFKYSRNPLYLGAIILLFGLGIITDVLWLIIFIPLTIILIQIIFIKPEEKYLSKKFGEDYKKYLKKTRRWI